MHLIRLFLLGFAATTASLAQPLVSPLPNLARPATEAGAAEMRTERAPVSPAEAILVSVGMTTAALTMASLLSEDGVTPALIIGGVTLGPSMGNLIQGAYRDALIGTGLRVGGGLLMLTGFVGSFENGTSDLNGATFYLGAATVLAGGIYDVATAGGNAHRARLVPAADLESGTPLAVFQLAL